MELGEVYVKIGADIVPLEKALGKARSVTKKTTEQMRAQMKTIGMGMVIAGAAITAAFALTAKSAISFQKELAQVSTMLDESAMKIMPQYKKGLLEMSMAFGESTDTLSRGLYDILSASIPPAQALEVLAVAAQAATAGVTDTGVAADAITTILNSYGFSADKAGEVSDKLFAIVKRGKLTFDELAPAIGKVAAMAAKTGLSFDELGAMIATLTRAGIRTNEAMTSINGVLRAFLKPSDEAKEAAKGFGLEMNTTTISSIGLRGAMDKLRDATAEQLAQIFPNIRGLKGLMAALGDVEGYTKDYELMLNSAGLTQIAFGKQSATLGFKIEQLKKSFNVIAVTIGDALIPVIQSIVVSIGKVTATVSKWMEENPKLTATLVKLAAAFGVFTMTGGLLILGSLYFTNLKTAVLGVQGVAKLLPATLGKLKIAMSGLGGVVSLIALNIILLSEVWKTWQKIAWDSITTADDVAAAQANLLRVQEETAKKWGVTLEVYQEWAKSGEHIREINEDVAAILEKLGAEKAFEKLKEDARGLRSELDAMKIELSTMKIGSEEWQILSQSIEETEEALTDLHQKMADLKLSEGIQENAKIIKTTVAGITLDIDLLAKGFEVTGKSVEESATYYGTLIEKLNAIDIILQTELMLLEKGTEEYKKKQAEILENAQAISEVEKNLKKLIEPLEGLELIATKMALLGDSAEDTKAKIELLNEKAVLLQQALDEAVPDTEAWWEAKLAFEENQGAIDGLTEKLSELTEEEKEAIKQAEKLADAYKSITDKIYELTHTPMENAIYKLDQQRQAYLDLGVEIGVVNKWYDLQIAKLEEDLGPALDDTTDKLKEAGKAAENVGILGGKGWDEFTTSINRARISLSNFTKEGLAAMIATIKMKFFPVLQDLYASLETAGSYAFIVQGQIANVLKMQAEQIATAVFGLEAYQEALASLGGTQAGGGGIASFQFGTPYVPKTGLALVHRGERITPANQNTYQTTNTQNNTINIPSQGGNVQLIARAVEQVLYDTGRQFKRRGFEVLPGRG